MNSRLDTAGKKGKLEDWSLENIQVETPKNGQERLKIRCLWGNTRWSNAYACSFPGETRERRQKNICIDNDLGLSKTEKDINQDARRSMKMKQNKYKEPHI